MSAFMGCDPGSASGAIAIVGSVVEAHKMPETCRDILDLVVRLKSEYGVEFALIEEIHALPQAVAGKLGIKRGSVATAKLNRNYGHLEMALTAAGIPFQQMLPAAWQKLMDARTHGVKAISRARAQQLFPQLHVTLQTGDALLIAKCAQMIAMQARGEKLTLPPAPDPKAEPDFSKVSTLFD